MIRRFSFLIALAGMIAPAMQAQQTKVLTAEKHNEYGLVYTLPTTALQVEVTARKVTRKAGPYRQYAKHYLGTTNVVQEDGVAWTITRVDVTAVGVKDDDTQYLMQLKPGATTFIGVASNGMLLSINAEPEDPDFEIGGPVEQVGKVIKSDGGVDDFLQYVDMDFVSAQNSMRQAEMVASSLMDVRDAYLSLTRGTADNTPTDGRQLELMLNSLKDQEAAFTRAFAGSVTEEEFTSKFTYIPEEDGEEILFRLSDFNGIVDPTDYSGAPVYIRTEVLMEGQLPTDPATGEPKKFPKDGIVYAIPGTARISLTAGNKPLYSKEMEFAQFGTKFALSPTLFTDKKAPSAATFSPVTGAVEEIRAINNQ